MPQPKRQVSIVCEVCGQDFTVKKSASTNRRYCSWACRKIAGDQTKATATCAQCGKPFETYKAYSRKYCSISCGMTARNLTEQNPAFHRDISGPNNPMHGKGQKGQDNGMYGRTRNQNPAWRGGRKVRKDGYILVTAPENHPYPISNGQGKGSYILEHRLVMERHLGRYLEPTEVVHHIDGNPSNNAIENLRLHKSQSDHIKIEHPGLR